MGKRYSIICFFFFVTLTARTQDLHYSQFFNSPLNLNPSLSGMFRGDYRFAANLRSQWASVTVPFTTFSFSADAQNPLGTKNLGAGITINHDQAGDSHFKTFQVNLSGAYIKSLNRDSTLVFSGGVQLGMTVRSLSYDALKFDEQFNGYAYNEGLPTGENFQRDSRMYPNIGIGASIYKKLEGRQYVLGGIAFSNVQSPRQSFYNTAKITLDRKFNLHAEGAYTLADKWDIIPSANIQFQGKYAELVPGATGRYVLIDEKGLFRALNLGAWYRFKDAFYVLAGVEYDNWKAAISYDVNLSDLVPASNKRGAFEIGLIYIIDNYNPRRIMHRICPDYL